MGGWSFGRASAQEGECFLAVRRPNGSNSANFLCLLCHGRREKASLPPKTAIAQARALFIYAPLSILPPIEFSRGVNHDFDQEGAARYCRRHHGGSSGG